MSFQIWFMFTFCREIKWCFFFEVNQVLNLYNTINYVNFFYCFFVLLAVILHMTVISPSFIVSNQRFPILDYKNDQLPLIITVNFVCSQF